VHYETLVASGESEYLRAAPLTVRDRLDAVRVRKTSSTVTIGVRQTIEFRGKRVAFVSAGVVVPVRLARPLGGRRLLHEPVDASMANLAPVGGDLYIEIDGPGPAPPARGRGSEGDTANVATLSRA